MMSITEELLQRVHDDEKYKSIVSAVDEDVARSIELVVRTFIIELAKSFPDVPADDASKGIVNDG